MRILTLQAIRLEIDIDIAGGIDAPSVQELRCWVSAALSEQAGDIELSVRIVGEDEGRALNRQWRGRDYATNVLAFPGAEASGLPVRHLGDVVICAPVVAREAGEQGKSPAAHWAHMIVHGILHLTGHDHEHHEDARQMEQTEVRILSGLGFPDPYNDLCDDPVPDCNNI